MDATEKFATEIKSFHFIIFNISSIIHKPGIFFNAFLRYPVLYFIHYILQVIILAERQFQLNQITAKEIQEQMISLQLIMI